MTIPNRPASTALAWRCLAAASILALVLTGCGEGDGNGNGNGGTNGNGAPESDVGEPCPDDDPGRCDAGICLFGDAGQTYCSAYCGADDTCPEDFPCQRLSFSGDRRDVCAPPCDADSACESGSCDLDTGRCSLPPAGTQTAGEACGGGDGFCAPGLVCLTRDGASRCVETCDPGPSAFCADGTLCLEANAPDGGICWLGGEVGPDGSCQSPVECVAGHTCVSVAEGTPTCQPACQPGGAPGCEEGTTCRVLEEGRLGACLP